MSAAAPATRRRAGFRSVTGTTNGRLREPLLGRLIIAIDDVKALAEEEMKVILDADGMLVQITKVMDPAHAHGEYMGVTLIEPAAAVALADCLETTWRRDPHLYYEDGFAEFSERGGTILAAPIGAVDWVEVDALPTFCGPGKSPAAANLALVSRTTVPRVDPRIDPA